MDFYNATEAKQQARNKERILKEINDIKERISQAIADNLFECDVYDTVMTDSRETAQPITEAKAHCVMELSKIALNFKELLDEIYCNHAFSEEPWDIINCGDAFESERFTFEAVGGDAYGNYEKPQNYYRVGEVLVPSEEALSSLEFKVSEVNKNGDIINMEIVSRGEFDEEVLDLSLLQYKDMDKWLDIDTDFGSLSELQLTRNNELLVKDYKYNPITSRDINWLPVNNIITANSLPPQSFGIVPDVYIGNQNEIYIKTSEGWVLSNKIYDYVSFKMPLDFEEEGTVCYNVFDKTWVKTHCGWYISPEYIDLGDLTEKPNVHDYNYYAIVQYNIIALNENGEVVSSVPYKEYKCCHNVWKPVLKEVDWAEKPVDNFGKNLDMFIYPEGHYRVKVNDAWYICPEEWRFENMYLDDNFGEIHDVIVYTNEYAPYTTYVKMDATEEYPNGHWTQVQKIWNMNELLLGRIPVDIDLLYSIKSIVVDEGGEGYMYPTMVIFSEGDAIAKVTVIDDKIVDVKLLNKGDDYVTIPEVNFVMDATTESKKYYQVWKRLLENDVLQDEMHQVIKYFAFDKKYSIARVTNPETGDTFYWHLQWN